MIEIWVEGHAQTHHNVAGIASGHFDVELIETPFPQGESYQQVDERMRSFLQQLAVEHPHEQVMLVGHAATLRMLEHLIGGRPLGDAVRAGRWPERPWRFALQGPEAMT